MSQLGAMIVAPARLGIRYAERLLVGISPQSAARYPRPGGETIVTNHASFVLGHLALYPGKLLALLGQPAGDAACPAEWVALFEAGAECQDDAAGTVYPGLATLREKFYAGYHVAFTAVAAAPDELLLQPHPDEARRENFPTLGATAGFYLGGHVMTHLGQLSAWRRAMGLPAA